MNILVITASGKVVVRPDTTWERDNEDLYVPEFVSSMSWTPVLFARVSKPGRSVGEKFADRYYDGVGLGALLYPDDLIDGSAEGFACASCLDHSSFLPFPPADKIVLRSEMELSIEKGSETIFQTKLNDPGIVERAIAEVTKFCYIRTGDVIAIELTPREPFCKRAEERCSLSGSLNSEKTLDFGIIY